MDDFKTFKSQKAQKTLASAIQIGNPISLERAQRTLQKFSGIVEQATEDELANAAARADRTGLFTCPHTGVALAVLFKLVERKQINSADKVLVISTAHGLKFPDFKIDYHKDDLAKFEVTSRFQNQPLELEATYEKVRYAVLSALEKG